MNLLPLQYEANGGIALLSASPVPKLLAAALAAQKPANQIAFTRSLTTLLRNTADGWSAAELKYTTIQPSGSGRPRAIDFFHAKSKVAVEMELGNQTCFSHDLLKIEVAFLGGIVSCGVILAVTEKAAAALGWNHATNSSYLNYESAEEFLRIFRPAMRAPIALMGFDV